MRLSFGMRWGGKRSLRGLSGSGRLRNRRTSEEILQTVVQQFAGRMEPGGDAGLRPETSAEDQERQPDNGDPFLEL
jgi:hypothetical protein